MDAVCLKCSGLLNGVNFISAAPCGHVYHTICLEMVNQNSAICLQCGLRSNFRSVRKLHFNFLKKSSKNTLDLENEIASLKAQLWFKEDELEICKREKECNVKDTEKILNAMEEHAKDLANEVSRLGKIVKQDEKLLRRLRKRLLKVKEAILFSAMQLERDIEDIIEDMSDILH